MSTDRDLMDVIDQGAKLAATGTWKQSLDGRERYEIAWAACAETAVAHHREHGVVPHASLLVADGMRAISDETYEMTRARGLHPGSARAHAAYWWDLDQMGAVRADASVDRIATRQALAALTDTHRDDLTLVASLGTIRAAAEVAGVGYSHMAARVREARMAFFGAWFWPEPAPTLPTVKVYDRKQAVCLRGHERAPWNVYRSGGCKECRAEKYAAKREARAAA